MRAQQIAVHVRRKPFQPIRIHLSDGSHYDVLHPEMVAVSQLEVGIGLPPFEDDVPMRFIYCDPLHITRIEPLNGES